MYTEDDEKGEVKTDNSSIKEVDFYTSFNDIEKDTKKTKKAKKTASSKTKETPSKPKEDPPVQEEEDYQDFYGNNDEVVIEDNGKKNIKRLIIAGIALILIIVLVIVIAVIIGNKPKGNIELEKTEISLEAGKKEYISYKIVGTESAVTSKFESSDDNVAIVDDNGEITGLNEGEAVITIKYTIDGVTREQKCTVKVTGKSNIVQNVTLQLKLTNGKDNVWTNKDVTIEPEASSIYGIETIKYAINCTDNCEYKDITDSKIKISSSGITKVKVVATDKKKREATKEVTIKIDKDPPVATLVGSTNIKSNKNVSVCATCSDKLSGCIQGKICKSFTTSKSNQVIVVEDAAGNKASSKSFNVTINKVTAPCSLSISKDGTVTATVHEEATYYGFNENYTGSNETSKKIDIPSVTKVGESAAKPIYYYVKTKNGNGGKCFITVVKICVCASGSTGANCTPSCTFRLK